MDEHIKPVAPAPIRITEQGLTGERFTVDVASRIRDGLNQLKPKTEKRLAERAVLAVWLATPRVLRDVKSQQELAAILGVSETSMSLWKREPEFKKLFDSALIAGLREEISEVVQAGIAEAKAGNVQAMRFVFEVYGDKFSQPEHGNVNVATQVNVNLSDPFAEEQVKEEELPTWASEGNGQ